MASIACVPLIRLMPSLECSSMAAMPGARSASPPGRIAAFEFRLAFADQHQRHVRQRSQIAAARPRCLAREPPA